MKLITICGLLLLMTLVFYTIFIMPPVSGLQIFALPIGFILNVTGIIVSSVCFKRYCGKYIIYLITFVILLILIILGLWPWGMVFCGQIMKRIKFFILLALLCSTFFLRECGGPTYSSDGPSIFFNKWEVVDERTYYTFSFGFVFPYFDIDAFNDGEFQISYIYNIFLSVIINLIFIALCTILIFKINLEKWKKVISKLYISMLINIIIFDISIFYSYTKIIKCIFEHYIFFPLTYIMDFLYRFLKIDIGNDLNILSRIYFLVATSIIYLIMSLFEKLRRKLLCKPQAKYEMDQSDIDSMFYNKLHYYSQHLYPSISSNI